MITYEIPVLIGAENTDDGPLIKTHDSGVNLQVKLLRMKRVSSWREIPEPYIIPEGTTAVFRAKNPDGTKTVVDVTPEPGKNTVFCELPPEALPTKGTCKAEIVLYSAAGERLTSATFCYRVEAECVCDDDPESEDYVEVFKDLKKKVVDLETQVDEALGPEHIQNAVTEYLKENPVEAGATAEEAAQIRQNKADIEQLTKDKLDADKLPEAVNDALAQAKASGEFDGADGKDGKDGQDGYTPQKGVDYFDGQPGADGKDYVLTEVDKQDIAELTAPLVDVPSGGGAEPSIIFDSGEIEEEVNLIGPIDISGYSKIRILGKGYPSANSAGKRPAMLCFEKSAFRQILCNAGNNKLFDTAGNPVAFIIYLDKGANVWTTHSFSNFYASAIFDSTEGYCVSSLASTADGGSLIYTNLYNEKEMYICAQNDMVTRPWGVGTRIMVVGDV